MGYKEHGQGHAMRSAETAKNVLKSLGCGRKRTRASQNRRISA